jgi:hypothetical protein
MKVLALRSLNCSRNAFVSDGRSQVLGKNWNSF